MSNLEVLFYTIYSILHWLRMQNQVLVISIELLISCQQSFRIGQTVWEKAVTWLAGLVVGTVQASLVSVLLMSTDSEPIVASSAAMYAEVGVR